MNSYTSIMASVLSEKGQVTIPAAIRKRLGLKPGQVLEFRAEAGEVRISKAKTKGGADSVFGLLKKKGATDRIMRELRGTAD